MMNRGGIAMSGLSLLAAFAVMAAILGIIGWYGDWFRASSPQTEPASSTTEQSGSQQQPSSQK